MIEFLFRFVVLEYLVVLGAVHLLLYGGLKVEVPFRLSWLLLSRPLSAISVELSLPWRFDFSPSIEFNELVAADLFYSDVVL